ncbi:MAG: lipopolysaccharide heptosyltransferase II [bacterium]
MSSERFKSVNKILLISLSCIGDVILTTPVMKALKDNFPGSKITVVVGPTAAPLLKCHEWVDSVIVYENKGRHAGFRGVVRLVNELRSCKYDLVVDLRNSAIPYFLRTRYRVTSHAAHIRNQKQMKRHAIDRHLDVLEAAGIHPATRELHITIPADAEKKVGSLLEARGLTYMKNLIAVYPGAGSPYKLYPAEKFSELLRMLKMDVDLRFALIGSGPDRPICEKIAAETGNRAVSLAGELDILETGALLRKCRLLISNDSGPMHLGAAVGTPVVAIFGPTNADRYGPRGDRHQIVWRRESCNPCKSPECGHESCINEIQPEAIAAAARSLLKTNNG